MVLALQSLFEACHGRILSFVVILFVCCGSPAVAVKQGSGSPAVAAAQGGNTAGVVAEKQLIAEETVLYRSTDPLRLYAYSPAITVLPNGRLIAVFDLGGPEVAQRRKDDPAFRQNRIYTSDNHGKTWTYRSGFNRMHVSRPFAAGDSVYLLGLGPDLTIARSDDNGTTWSEPVRLTRNEVWHQAPGNVWYANGNVYLVMERVMKPELKTWKPSVLAPVLMRAKVGDDLTKRDSWTFASELSFSDAVDVPAMDYTGIPFFPYEPNGNVWVSQNRNMTPPGWLESHVVQILDPDHYWYDPQGHTFHLLMRAHTGGTGFGALAKVTEQPDGSMLTELEQVPSGKRIAFLPLPGGQMKFHIVYDEQTRLYWLLSTQATDSMTRADKLPADRYNLPNNERHRLQLHFSRNLVDWCFAGMVALGDSSLQTRHYASMAIDGDDLLVLSRSGDDTAQSAHDGNLITFHSIKNFRSLVY